MDELPHRAIVDVQTALPGQFLDQAAQREGLFGATLAQPLGMAAGNLLRLVPAIWPGAKLPLSSKRPTQWIAVLTATPKRWAAWLRDIPSCVTAATTRARRSIE